MTPVGNKAQFYHSSVPVENPIFDVQNNNAANASDLPGEYSLQIDDLHNARTLADAPPPSYIFAHMENYSFNEEHYRSRCLSYGYITELTELEINAFQLGNIWGCVKWGVLSRIVKAASCCLFVPFIAIHSVVTCVISTCAFCATTLVPDMDEYECYDYSECINYLCSSGCIGWAYTAVLCAECWTNVICCPAEVCIPECMNRAGLPWVYRLFENKKSVLWKRCQDFNND